MARAINSLPVPVSPVSKTVESVGATLDTRESTARSTGEAPTTSSNMETRSTAAVWGQEEPAKPLSLEEAVSVDACNSGRCREVPGAWITVRQLQTNPVETPVEILISGQADTDAKDEAADIQTLRGIATQTMDVLGQAPGIAVLRDDWSPDSPQVRIQIDPDRANVVGITNADVANSTAAAITGAPVGLLREGNKSIPIVARLRGQERAQLGQIENLYVYSSQQTTRVPLRH